MVIEKYPAWLRQYIKDLPRGTKFNIRDTSGSSTGSLFSETVIKSHNSTLDPTGIYCWYGKDEVNTYHYKYELLTSQEIEGLIIFAKLKGQLL